MAAEDDATVASGEVAACEAPAAPSSEPVSRPTDAPSDPPALHLTVELSGGLELLFGQIKTFNVELVLPADASRALTMQDLLTWMRLNLLRERPELFLAEGDNLRAGILCLINEADWELEDTVRYELQDMDTICFISTLHGG